MIHKVILTKLLYLITKDKQILTKKFHFFQNILFLDFIVSIVLSKDPSNLIYFKYFRNQSKES